MEGAEESMSNEVDKRIVEMQFKNEDFEKNAAKTLQTLQELKQKLNNNFSTKGPEQLNQAIKAVDVSPITKGLETVQLQFSALQIAGKRVIENITDMAMNAIRKVTNLIQAPLNQIKQGGATRAQNIEQAKFMLSGLGIEWKDIVEDINYGVQDTAYGLDAAAKVASQLVASNVSLGKDMQASLRGVSGVAAMTNSTYEEIGHIFTSVAGQGKLMTMQLQQFSLRGLNVAADLAKAMNTTEAEIRDMVTKGKIDFMTFAKAMDELYGGHAKEANNTFIGALSNTKAALSRLGADIQAQKFESFRIILLEVTTQLKDFKKAIKPAEDAIIEMMAAVGNLVANFVKTANLKAIAEKIVPPIKKAAEYVRDFADAWRRIREEAVQPTNVAEFITKLKTGTVEAKEATDDAITSLEKLSKLKDDELKKHRDQAFDIWNFGTYGNGQDRIDALGDDYELTQAYVDKMIELGWDEAKMEEYLNEQREKAEKQEARRQAVERLKVTVAKVLNIFTNLRTVAHNVTSSIVNILKTMFGGLTDALSGKGTGFLDALIYLTGKLADFTTKIAITKDRAEKIRPIFKTIGDIVVGIAKGLYKCIQYLIKFIESASKNKIVRGIFEAIANAINKMFEGLKKIYTKMKESGAWDKFIDILKTVATWIGEKIIFAFDKFGDIADTVADKAISLFGKLSDKVKDFSKNSEDGASWLDKIKDFFKEDILSGSWLEKLKQLMTDIFGEGKDIYQRAFNIASDFVNGLVNGIKNLSKQDIDNIIHTALSIGFWFATIKTLWNISRAAGSIADLNKGIEKLFSGLLSTIKKYGKKADAERFKEFATSVAIIIGSIIALMVTYAELEGRGFDATKILNYATQVVLTFVVLVGVLKVIRAAVTKVAGAQTNVKTLNIHIPQVAITMFAIVYMVKSIIEAMATLYNIKTSKGFNLDALTNIMYNMVAMISIIAILSYALVKASPSLKGISQIGVMFMGIGLLINMLIKSMAKVLETIKGEDMGTVAGSFALVETFLLTVAGIAVALVALPRLIDKIPGGSATYVESNRNPFKGMFTMLLGLAALIRLGFVPFLETLAELRKEESGIRAIEDFQHITKWILIFIGGLAVVLSVLDRAVNYTSAKNLTRAGLLQGAQNTSNRSFSSTSSNGTFWGLAAIVATIAAVFSAIGYMIKNMKGLDSETMAGLQGIMTTITILLIVITAIGAIAGQLDQTRAATGVLLSIAAIIAAVAATFLAAGYGFKAFEEALTDLIHNLPNLINELLEFFEMIAKDAPGGHTRGGNTRSKLIQGLQDMASLALEAVTAAVIGWAEGLADSIPRMVKALMSALITTLYSVGDEFIEQGPDVVDAANHFAVGITSFLILAAQKAKETFGGAAKYIVGKTFTEAIEMLVPGLDLDYSDELKEWEKSAEKAEQAREEALARIEAKKAKPVEQDADWYSLYYGGSKAVKSEFKEYEIFNKDAINKQVNDFKESILSGYTSLDVNGIKSYLGSTLSWDNLSELINMGDYGQVNDIIGNGFNIQSLEGLYSDLDLSTEEGTNTLMQRFEDFFNNSDSDYSQFLNNLESNSEEQMKSYSDAVEERMQFVTDLTQEGCEQMVGEMKKFDSEFYDAGKYCTQGFADGLLNEYAMQRVKQNSYEVADHAKISMENRLQEESPSKVFNRIGKFVTMGFANGIAESVSYATASAQEVGEDTILSMRNTIKQITEDTMYGLDTNPRITPVLDLSNVTEGIGEMNGMFDMSHVTQLGLATSTEAKAATNRRLGAIYQNGSNYDDTNAIGAINSLQGEVSTLKDAINGMQVVIDGRALVGQIATPMDKALGRKALAGRRGV